MTVRIFGRGGQGDEPIERRESPRGAHLSSRTGLITLYAVLSAVLVAILTFVGGHLLAAAVAAGVLAFGGFFTFFDKIIGD
jgi:hypothetical protein